MQKKSTNQLWFKNPLLLSLTVFIFSLGNAYAQTTYTWIGGAGSVGTPGNYATAANWSPARNTPAANDIIVFNTSNVNGTGTASNIFVTSITTETVGQLQVIQSGAPVGIGGTTRTVTFSGTPSTLTVTGNLTIQQYCQLADGGYTISVGGDIAFQTSSGSNATVNTVFHSGAGKIQVTGTSSRFFNGTGVSGTGNYTFGNIEISGASAILSMTISYNAIQVNGTFTINQGRFNISNATSNRTFILNSTSSVTPTGLIQCINGGVIVGGGNGTLQATGLGPVSGNSSVGTLNFDATSVATSTLNTLTLTRINSTLTIGTVNASGLTISGSLVLNTGTLDDGGNTINTAGGSMFTTSNIIPGAAIYKSTGSGRVRYTRTNGLNAPIFFNSGTTASKCYLEVGNIIWVPSSATTINPLFNSATATSNISVTLNGSFNFTRNGSGSPTITVNDKVDTFFVAPAASITIPTGLTFDFNSKPVILQSDAAGTASIGTINGTLSNATNVTVQRYIPSNSRKSYTMVTSPVSSPTINAAWQEGGATIANYGTQITGAVAGNGFDAASASGFPSIFTYNDANATGKWVGLTNTDVNTLAAGKGYLLYVRGDRAEARHTTGASSNTTLRATGTITTGDVTPTLTTTANSLYNLVANPYPCAIDWTSTGITKTSIADAFWVYDPTDKVFVSYNGGIVSPANARVTQYLQSGQAFFIQNAVSGTPSITFTEAAKTTAASTAANNTVFGEEEVKARMNINIYSKSNNELADGVVAIFGNNYKAGIAKEDAGKMDNFNETFALTRNNNRLSIEGRPTIKGNDTLFFAMNNFSKKEYVLKIDGSNFSEANATLLDNYTGTKTAIDLAQPMTYNFTVNGDDASAGNDRFMITFGSTTNIAAGETTETNNLFVKLSPNPVSNQLQVDFKTATTESTVIKVINSLGQTVKTVNAGKVNAGNITIPATSLSAGLYTVQLISGDKKIATQKIVKQ